jgi:2-haloacid dehalogenase
MDLRNIKAITFDCYGTLIDWESGLTAVLQSILQAHNIHEDKDSLLERYARIEAAEEAGDYRNYKLILATVLKRLGGELRFSPTDDEYHQFSHSVGNWPAFADTAQALGQLKQRFRLVIISNVDDDLFARTNVHLGIEFGDIITAEQSGAYKPSEKMFSHALERIGLPVDEILHVAQSIYHDIVPAQKLGLKTVWINRRQGLSGFGATPAAVATPDFEFPDLKSLAALLADQS